MEFDEIIGHALAAAPVKPLRSCPLSTPTAAQSRIASWCVRRGRELLPLPETVVVRWVAGEGADSLGAAERTPEGTYRIIVTTHLRWPEQLARVIFHELQHLSDYSTELRASPVELEHRAIDFSESVVRSVRW